MEREVVIKVRDSKVHVVAGTIWTTASKGNVGFFVDDMGIPHLIYDGMEIVVTRSEADDVHLVFIDTRGDVPEDAAGPLCRIDLNDATIYENPPFQG